MDTTEMFETTEVAYYTPGKGWKRKVLKTKAAFDRFIASLDDDVIVQTSTDF